MPLSRHIRDKWLIVAIIFAGGLLATLSGIYFLYMPIGGYQGGRNALYGKTFLFVRSTWEDLHTLGGVIMLAAVLVHLVRNWRWVAVMSKQVMRTIYSVDTSLTQKTKVNLVVNLLLGLSFLGSAISGIHFLLDPRGGFQGGRNLNWNTSFLITESTWDLIHTWAGVLVIIAVLFHLVIHWKWIVKTSQAVFNSGATGFGFKSISKIR